MNSCHEFSHDVFISLAKEDLPIGIEIVDKLESEYKIPCWIYTRDSRKGSHYDNEIAWAIEYSKAVVLLQSRYSIQSEQVAREIRLAQDTYNKKVFQLVFDNAQWKGTSNPGVGYFLATSNYINVDDVLLDPAIASLTKDLCAMIKDPHEKKEGGPFKKDGKDAPAQSFCTPKITAVLDSKIDLPDRDFQFREKEVKKIYDGLHGKMNRLFMWGEGGVGKSELARKYAEEYGNEYDLVRWITFNNTLVETIINDSNNGLPLKSIKRSDFPEDSDEQYFKRKMNLLKEHSSAKTLLILDNFDIICDDPQWNEFSSGAYTLLVTSKYRRNIRRIPEIEICPFAKKSELIALYQNYNNKTYKKEKQNIIWEIIKHFDRNTLCIRLISENTRYMDPEDVLAILKKDKTGSKQELNAIQKVYDGIKQIYAISALSEEEQSILKNLSLLPTCGITVGKIYDLCAFDFDYSVIDGLIQKKWIKCNNTTNEVFLHSHIEQLASALLQDDLMACIALLENLKSSCQYSATNVSSSDRKLNLKLSESIYKRIPKDHPLYETAVYCYAYCILDSTHYSRAATLYTELLAKTDDLEKRVNYCEKAAQCYILSGNPEKGKEIALEGWNEVKDLSVNGFSALLGKFYTRLMHRLIESHRDLSDYDTALLYGEQCLKNCSNFYEVYNGDSLAWTKYHMGKAYLSKGELPMADKLLNEALKTFQQNNDKNAEGCLKSLMARLFLAKEDYPQALTYSEQAENLLLSLLDTEHIDIANNYRWRGDIYMKMKKHCDAIACYKKALAIYQKKNCTTFEKETVRLLDLANTSL